MATADDEGRVVVDLAAVPRVLNVNITSPGYGPYWASWSSENHAQPIPARFTADLEAGWSVGGIVVDPDGNPVSGAKIHPSIEYKKRPGDQRQLATGATLTTDAEGRWRFDSVPASLSEVPVTISHKEFMPERRPLTRNEFGVALDREPSGQIMLDRGLTVVGLIIDDKAEPIAGALVRAKFTNDIREARSGDDGSYRLVGCEPRTAKIVVSAPGHATDMKQVKIDTEMEPVDFQMKPGGHVRIRVLDENDKPIPKARIFYQRWRGDFAYFEFQHKNQYADNDGVWEWNEAPLDSFEADICRPGGMSLARQLLVPRQEEYVFRPPPALVVSGKVVDAETKELVRSFRVVPGIRSDSGRMDWARGEQFTANDGTYRVRQVHDYFAHLVRVEADGYRPAVSRNIKSNEGNVSVDFELVKGTDVTVVVLTPDGQPAVGAQAALGVAGAQINIENGSISPGQTYAAQYETDTAGRFHFPPQETASQLVVVHAAGCAHVKVDDDASPQTIKLAAWARVEGTYRVGQTAPPGVPITLNPQEFHSYGMNAPSIFTSYNTTTGKDGHFVFERVVPGKARVGRRIMLLANEGALDVTSACMAASEFPPGKTTILDLGGTGRAVAGRLQPPADFRDKVPWNFASVQLHKSAFVPPKPDDPPVPPEIKQNPVETAAWLERWQQQTPEGRAWFAWKLAVEENQKFMDLSPWYTATVDREGRFRIDDVPEGEWTLSARVDRKPGFGLQSTRVTVPAAAAGEVAKPIDLGELQLE